MSNPLTAERDASDVRSMDSSAVSSGAGCSARHLSAHVRPTPITVPELSGSNFLPPSSGASSPCNSILGATGNGCFGSTGSLGSLGSMGSIGRMPRPLSRAASTISSCSSSSYSPRLRRGASSSGLLDDVLIKMTRQQYVDTLLTPPCASQSAATPSCNGRSTTSSVAISPFASLAISKAKRASSASASSSSVVRMSNTIQVTAEMGSPASHAATGPSAWQSVTSSSSCCSPAATKRKVDDGSVATFFEKLDLPQAQQQQQQQEDPVEFGMYRVSNHNHNQAGHMGWVCVACGNPLNNVANENGIYVCDANGCGTVQTCTHMVNDGREKNCRADEDKTLHADVPWDTRPKYGLRNTAEHQVSAQPSSSAEGRAPRKYARLQGYGERASVQDALTSMYGSNGPAIARSNTRLHTNLSSQMLNYGSVIDDALRSRVLGNADSLSVNAAIHKMCCNRSSVHCQLNVMATPSTHLAMLILDVSIEQELAKEELEREERQLYRPTAATGPRAAALEQLRRRVSSDMQDNCHGQSEVKLRLSATIVRTVLGLRDSSASQLRTPCDNNDGDEARLYQTPSVPSMPSTMTAEEEDEPRPPQRQAQSVSAKAGTIITRLRARAAALRNIPQGLRCRLTALIRNGSLEIELRSILHVPGICNAVIKSDPPPDPNDPLTLSDAVLVGLLVDALVEATEAQQPAPADSVRIGWSAQALQESQHERLSRAVVAVKSLFRSVVNASLQCT